MGGRMSTHVANAYSQPIYVMADAERRRLTQVSASINQSVGVDGMASFSQEASMEKAYDINIIQAGFSKILPGEFLRFDVDYTKTETVYVSVFYMDMANGKPYWIVNELAREDVSVIITNEGQLVDSVYGNKKAELSLC